MPAHSRQTTGFVVRVFGKAVHVLVLLSILATSSIGIGAANAQGESARDSAVYQAQPAVNQPKYTHPAPRVGERPQPEAEPQSQSYPSITCLENCTQVDPTTITYSGSGSTPVGEWYYRPPVRYQRQLEGMRVYYLFQGIRVVSQNVCSNPRDHMVLFHVNPGFQVYQSASVSVPPNGYHEFVLPTINTWFDHATRNRTSNIEWTVIRGPFVSCPVAYTWSVDKIVVSSKPIDMATINLGATWNTTACRDGDCETGGALRGTVGTAADPVNTRSGAFSYSNADLSVSTSAGDLIFERSYSSGTVGRPPGALAPGWTHNHAARLIFPGDPGGVSGYVIFRGTAGNDYLFKDNGNYTYTAGPGVTASLTRASGPPVTYTVKTFAQSTFKFDSTGVLVERTDTEGRAFSYSYDGNGLLDQVSSDGGTRYLDFTYDAQDRIESVADHTGRDIGLSYDAAGDLVGYTDVLDRQWTYVYDSNHLLTEIIDPDLNQTVRNEYEITSPLPIDFDHNSTTYYAGENTIYTVTKEDEGLTLHIVGNTWRRLSFPYTVTANTVLEFDFKSGAEGEIHGIGLDNDLTVNNGRVFQLYGTDTGGGKIQAFNDYAASAPGWKHYRINVYDYYASQGFAGAQLYLFLINDHDVANPTAESYFSNIRVYDAPVYSVARQYNGEDELTAEFEYNSDGTTTVTDALGDETTHRYNLLGALVEEIDPLGEDVDKTYNANFRPATITDAAGHTTALTWSANGANLTKVVDADGNETDITYDSLNNPTSIIDPRDFLTEYQYDGTLLTAVIDPFENETTYTYTAEGYLESVTDPLGHTTSYTYDSHGQRLTMTDHLNHTWEYAYDSLGRLADTTDPLDRVTHNEYDAAGQLVRVTRNYDPVRTQNEDNVWNIVTEYEYDVRGDQTAVIDTYSNRTEYEYDDAGRLVSTIDADGNLTTNEYNAAGQLVSATDPLLRVTTYEYDDAGRLIATSGPLGSGSETAYNPDGTVDTTTDALDRVTSYAYDSLKRATEVTQPNDGVVASEYDESGNLISTTDPMGVVTTYEYDALNRQIKQTDPEGGETESFYDDAGNLAQTIDARDNVTTYEYDELNRLVVVIDPLLNETTYEYDAVGRRAAVIDGNGNRTEYTYDGLDRVVAVTDALDHTAYTAYDALGRFLSQTDANGNTTTFDYDVLSRLVEQTDPMDGLTSFTYDDVGNRLTVTDANLHTTTTVYDDLNRPVSVTDANNHTVTTTYDAVGNVLTADDALENTTSFEYNEVNQRTKVTDPLAHETDYLYNARGELVLMTDAEGIVTRYEYDDVGRLTAVIENWQAGIPVDAETNVRTEYTYDLNGNRLTIKDANQQVSNFTYDELNRLETETDPLNHTWTYGYDAVGNRVSLLDANGATTTYVYDDANRLTNIDYPGTSIDVAFTYDAGGRRLTMTDGLGTTEWAYDDLNRVTSITDPYDATVGYDYDAVGNRTELTYPSSQTVAYTYDAANRLTTVDGLSTSVDYTYDAADRLTGVERLNEVNTAYAYDNASRLLSITHAHGVELLSSFEYTYDDVGNRVQAIEDVKPPEPPPTATSTATATETHTPSATHTPSETPLPTDTLTPSDTPLPSETPTFTSTATHTPTKTGTPQPFHVDIVLPEASGAVINSESETRFQAVAWDPAVGTTDGSGISSVRFEITGPDFSYIRSEGGVSYCAFGGDATCNTMSDGGVSYDALVAHAAAAGHDETYTIVAIAYDLNGVYAHDFGTFVIPAVPATGTPTNTETATATQTPTSTSTPTITPTPQPFHVDIVLPEASGIVINSESETGFQAVAWDPAVGTTDGSGISSIRFEITGPDFSYIHPEGGVSYCAFGGDATCNTMSGGGVSYAALVAHAAAAGHDEIYTIKAIAYDLSWSYAIDIDTFVIPAVPATSTPTPTETPTPTGTPTFTPSATFVPSPTATSIPSGPVTITYTYDPLYRLTAADYSDGAYYHYTYDSAGNRLTGQTHLESTSYEYDIANRLVEVDSVAYTWDDNGNLLSDGVSTYTYDAANRLSTLAGSGLTSSYAYNGLGDRYQQTVNSQTTTYALDINAGLTQVLDDGTYSYTYGLGRIAQVGATTEHFLGDALGSVRQLTAHNGGIVRSQVYDPYGNVVNAIGNAISMYGYTAEIMDSYIKLIYLRSRMYDPANGRFTTKDSWQGDYNRPMSLNHWMYVEGNPVNYTDPSGMITESEATQADAITQNLLANYGVTVKKDWGFVTTRKFQLAWPFFSPCTNWEPGRWTLIELQIVEEGVSDLNRALLGQISTFIGNVDVMLTDKTCGRGCTARSGHSVKFLDAGNPPTSISVSGSGNIDKWTVVHEFGHAWDRNYGWRLASKLENYTGGHTGNFFTARPNNCDPDNRLPGCNDAKYFFGEAPPAGSDNAFNRTEDFAESVTAYVYPTVAQLKVAPYNNDPTYGNILYYSDYTKTKRYAFINGLVNGTIIP